MSLRGCVDVDRIKRCHDHALGSFLAFEGMVQLDSHQAVAVSNMCISSRAENPYLSSLWRGSFMPCLF